MADIFLSHSSADNAAADKIKSWLERDRPTWSVFLDKHPRDGILAGQGWQDRLRAELQSCRLVVAIISERWLASRWCFTEAVTATFRGKDFVAILPSTLPENSFEAAPPIVHERQRKPLDLETGAGWDEILYALDHSGLDPTEWFVLPVGVGPYPGFVAFEEKDAGVFFGRDQEITTYLEELNLLKAPDRAQALVISGGSGSGKSSLMKAGLIPRLRQQPDWVIIPPFDPSREPIHALFHALREAGEPVGAVVDLPTEPPTSTAGLTEILQNTCRAIEEATKAWLLLPLDQAEVLVAGSRANGKSDASRLLDAVNQMLASRVRKIVAVLTIRTEFLPALERTIPSSMRLKQMPLGPITALSDAIEKPAERFGIELEAGLAGKMVEDTRGGGALPLLAYTLRELNEKHGEDKKLTLDEYGDLGGVEGAIEKKLHDALSDPEPTIYEIAAFRRTLVRHFVRVDETAVEGERYLRTAVSRDLVPEEGLRVAKRLEEARLIVGGVDDTLAIAHERLINNWPTLPIKDWLAADRDDRKLIENLRSRLIEYQDGGPLLREKSLLDAKDLLVRDRSLAKEEPELVKFIEESVDEDEAAKRRQKRRFAGVLALAGVALVVALGAVWFFLDAQEQQREALRQAKIAAAQTLRAREEATRAEEQSQLAREAEIQANVGDSLYRAEQARKMIRDSRPVTAMQLALAGLPSNPKQPDRHWVGETAGALIEALGAQRERHILRGHEGAILAVAVFPDGTRIVSGSSDKTVRIWDAASGAQLQVLKGHEGAITAIAVSPDGAYIVSGSFDETVRIWDAVRGTQLRVLQGHEDDVNAVAVSPDSTRIVSGSMDNTVRLWDAASGEQIQTLRGHQKRVNAVAVSPNGARVISGSRDKTIRIWDAASGEPLQVLEGHEGAVLAVAISPDGTRIVSGSGPPTIGASAKFTVRVWDAANGAQLQVLQGHEQFVTAVAVSPDGARIISGSNDTTIRIWDATSGELLLVLHGHQRPVSDIAVFPDDARIVSSSGILAAGVSPEYTLRIWTLESPAERQLFKGHQDEVTAVAVSPDGTRIFSGSGNPNWASQGSDNTVRIWDSENGKQVRVLEGHEGRVTDVIVSTDGTRIYSSSRDKTIRIWEAVSGLQLRVLKSHEEDITAVAVSPDGARIVSSSSSSHFAGASTLRVWDVANGATLQTMKGHQSPVRAVAVSPDGARVVSGSGTFDYRGPGDNTIRIWDAASGAQLRVLRGHEGVITAIAISPDGAYIVSGSSDYTVRIWDAASGEQLRVLNGHEGTVTSISISADGARIVSGSPDNSVRIWDAASGEQLLVIRGPTSAVELFPDGTRIVVGSPDNSVRIIWVGRNQKELIERAYERLPRAITEFEKLRFYLAK